jgi:hypothetical protein
MEKVEVWYLIVSGGDGSAYPHWFLTEDETEFKEEYEINTFGEGFGETCNGMIETFVGSNVHRDAVIGSNELKKIRDRLELVKDFFEMPKRNYYNDRYPPKAYKFVYDYDYETNEVFDAKVKELEENSIIE